MVFFILYNSFWLVCTEFIYIYIYMCVCGGDSIAVSRIEKGGSPVQCNKQYITYFCENDWAEFDCPSVSLSKAMPARGEIVAGFIFDAKLLTMRLDLIEALGRFYGFPLIRTLLP